MKLSQHLRWIEDMLQHFRHQNAVYTFIFQRYETTGVKQCRMRVLQRIPGRVNL